METARLPLDRGRVLRAALEMIDDTGLGALSMRALGARLGVQAMSLYEHVADKEALLDGVVELLIEEIEVPESEVVGWRDFLGQMSRSYRAVAQRHPAAFVLVVTRPLATPSALQRFEAALDGVRRSGFGPEAAATVFLTIEAFTSGLAMNEISGAVGMDFSALDRAAFPRTTELAPVLADAGPDVVFERCLDAVVTGLGTLRSATKPG